ncbi:hypothetical protein [Pelotomaculum sp. FP]|uniref:hypothetical protein n=1 Tax=Pelotomaculum sp. FP TaxID=261474 RepID=UPI0018651DB8|nr:hypothetical protein [Pelotomaculum sp. FP]
MNSLILILMALKILKNSKKVNEATLSMKAIWMAPEEFGLTLKKNSCWSGGFVRAGGNGCFEEGLIFNRGNALKRPLNGPLDIYT